MIGKNEIQTIVDTDISKEETDFGEIGKNVGGTSRKTTHWGIKYICL